MALMILFWLMFIAVSYGGIVFILIKGKQHNRYFGTFLSTIFPVIGSVPAYVMACKYEKRISDKTRKIKNKILKYVLAGMQLVSVMMLFLPIYKVGSVSVSLIGLIFGSPSYGGLIEPALFLIYIIVLTVISGIINLCAAKTNVSNFITYLVSFINIFSVLLYGALVSASVDVDYTSYTWVYAMFNVLIMSVSMFSVIVNRDLFLFRLEYSEKIEYIKEQKKKAEKKQEQEPENNTYKCSRCGSLVEKGKLCSCIAKKTETVVNDNDAETPEEKPASYCIYCKRPLKDGEQCNCQGEGFGITVKNAPSPNRKCMYCGQILVGESVCVCEKIMKNSKPVSGDEDTKRYFESQVEKGNVFVADELAELEKTINARFELLKENMDFSDENAVNAEENVTE